VLIAFAAFALGCGGGRTATPNPNPGGNPSQDDNNNNPPVVVVTPISLLISATPSSGTAPLEVNLFVSATGGREPYEYAWDFENDGVFDSSAQTPYHTYNVTSVAHVRVKDAEANEAHAYRTILVNGQAPPDNPAPLVALFGLDKLAGPVPLLVHFEGFATGGTPPYKFRWDFNNDGSFDAFSQNPFFTFETIGTPVDLNSDSQTDKWVYYPTLEVEDAIGRTSAYNAEINVYPASTTVVISAAANPPTGQAPLYVTFDGGAGGGVPPYEYKWEFGEGPGTDWSAVSQADYIYTSPGVYKAVLRVRDAEGLEILSGDIEVRVEEAQQLGVVISANVINATVPFSSNFTCEVGGGKEPYTFDWIVFSNSTILDDTIDPSRGLVGTAIVTPGTSNMANPTFHFASVPLTNINNNTVYDPIMVQLVVTDALGSESMSNVITITPQTPSFHYDAQLPVTSTFDGLNPNFSISTPGPRSNPAVTTHPFTGVTFMFGGDKVDTAGIFQDVAGLTDSAWVYNPNGVDPATDAPTGYTNVNGNWGSYTTVPVLYAANSWIVLNTVEQSAAGDGSLGGIGGGAFPVGPSRYMTPAGTTLRANQFVRRGSACAVYTHEAVETNPAGADYAGCVALGGIAGNFNPDDPNDQGLDTSPMNGPGLGVPVIYVIGGRDENGFALTSVQKYYPPGFGTELLPIDCLELCGCETGDFQITNNQVDIWRNTFLAPDKDMWPQVEDDPRIPIVPDRVPGNEQAGSGPLAQLPVGIYGHSGFAIESLPYLGSLPWPLGAFSYIYIMGGKEDDGHVSNEFRILDPRSNPNTEQGGGNDNPRNPRFPLWAYVRSGNTQNGPIQYMPVERYDFDVVMQWPDPSIGELWKVYVFGGTDQNGNYVGQVDVFTFADKYNPTTGTWSTISSLPKPAAGLNAAIGWNAGFVYHIFGGRTRDEVIGDVFTMNGSSITPNPMTVIPKQGAGMFHSFGAPVRPASDPWPNTFTYYRVAGMDETGLNPYVEKFQVP
jgi:PKD repeat protein